jgi:hypothetical protein
MNEVPECRKGLKYVILHKWSKTQGVPAAQRKKGKGRKDGKQFHQNAGDRTQKKDSKAMVFL